MIPSGGTRRDRDEGRRRWPPAQRCATRGQRGGRSGVDAPGAEAVVIGSPTPVHAGAAATGSPSRRHVLAEYAVATFLAEAEALVALADRGPRAGRVSHAALLGADADAHRWLVDADIRPTNVVAQGAAPCVMPTWAGPAVSGHGPIVSSSVTAVAAHVVDAALALLRTRSTRIDASGPVWPTSGRSMDHAISLRTRAVQWPPSRSGPRRLSASESVGRTDETPADRWCRGAHLVAVAGTGTGRVQDAAVAAQDADFLEAVRTGRARPRRTPPDVPSLRVLQAVSDLAAARAWSTMALADDAANREIRPDGHEPETRSR